jgi:uncharacterized membrane protein
MTILILGLVLFFGVHSVRILADDWRTGMVARIGQTPWKLAHAALSLAGLALIVWGYALARHDPVFLWQPPVPTRHAASLITLFALVLFAAAFVPRNGLKARLGHPMLLSVKLWALAHLLSNGTLADKLLFGAFLVWAVLAYRAARQRDRAAAAVYPAGGLPGTLATVVAGVGLWALFAFWLHAVLFGVAPFAA